MSKDIPAFPHSVIHGNKQHNYAGMSLRDYMAIRAPSEEIKPTFAPTPKAQIHNNPPGLKEISDARYEWADAMLEAREK